MNAPTVTVVTGTYNRLPLLQQMLASVASALPVGVQGDAVVCDGGSTDGTLDWLRTQPHVTLIEHGELRGAIRAFTDAAHAARGKYVVMANDDVLFEPDSISAALVRLETDSAVGAVAFEDDRQSGAKRGFGVQYQPAITHDGKSVAVPYAQVGMFRRWLGERVGWWGADDEIMGAARTYGGDNWLTSRILELGYRVEPVPGARCRDLVHADALRVSNGVQAHDDSAAYYRAYPHGARLQPSPVIANEDKRQLRVLYLPIFEPGHAVQKEQKRGLREALARHFLVWEVDYLALGATMQRDLERIIALWQPDVMLTQLQNAEHVTSAMLAALRRVHPRMVVINWNGDVYEQGLIAPPVLDLLRFVDLQLTVNDSVLPVYAERGIPAAYWQIGFEPVPDALPPVPTHEVVFLGNAYSQQRVALEQALNEIEHSFTLGLWGSGWVQSAGITLYDFAKGAAIYRGCKIAIGDNQYGSSRGFVSNRLFEALANGAFLLHQIVPGLEQLTGLVDGEHYVSWHDLPDLQAKIVYWLDEDRADERRRIAAAGEAFVRQYHNFDARVRELFLNLLPVARKQPRSLVAVRYNGPRDREQGVRGAATGRQYVYTPGTVLYIDPEDAPGLMAQGVWLEVNALAGTDPVADSAVLYGGR